MTSFASPSQVLSQSAGLPMPPRPNAKVEQIQKSAQDFESVYLAQMLQPMFNTVEVDDTFGGGQAEETWRGMLVEEYAKQISKSGGIGLASVVGKEMLKLQEVANGTKPNH